MSEVNNDNFQKFLDKTKKLIGKAIYSRPIVETQATLIIDLNIPSISILLKSENNCDFSFWNLHLTEEVIVDHFENECNIYEENGIIGLVDLFVSAIMGNISFYINHNDNKNLSLRLEYNIGHKIIVGLLNLPFIQFNIERVLFNSIESLSICHKSFKIINAGKILYTNILII